MLATWLAVLLFLAAVQAFFVVTLADRLTVAETASDAPAVRDASPREADERFAQAA